MKRAGIILLVVGFLICVFTGGNFVTEDKIVDVGPVQVTKDTEHKLPWSPLVGFAIMITGGVVYLFGFKK